MPKPYVENPALWTILFALAIAAFLVTGTHISGSVLFQLDDEKSIMDALMALLVTALFVERAQEVFLAAARREGRVLKDAAVEAARSANDEIALDEASKEVEMYRAETQRYAFALGLAFGFIVAFAGVRSLSQIVDFEGLNGLQLTLFTFTDITLTAGLIAGGSDGLHQLTSLVTDGLKSTRDRFNQ